MEGRYESTTTNKNDKLIPLINGKICRLGLFEDTIIKFNKDIDLDTVDSETITKNSLAIIKGTPSIKVIDDGDKADSLYIKFKLVLFSSLSEETFKKAKLSEDENPMLNITNCLIKADELLKNDDQLSITVLDKKSEANKTCDDILGELYKYKLEHKKAEDDFRKGTLTLGIVVLLLTIVAVIGTTLNILSHRANADILLKVITIYLFMCSTILLLIIFSKKVLETKAERLIRKNLCELGRRIDLMNK